MFKQIHPSFWWGIAIIYGYSAIFWILEMSIPGFIYYTKIGSAPACYVYALTIGLLVINLLVSFLWFYIPEQEEKKKAAEQAGKGVEQ